MKCMDTKMRYSGPLQDIVALTIRSFLWIITTLSDPEEYFSVHPFCPLSADCDGMFGKIHSYSSQLEKGCKVIPHRSLARHWQFCYPHYRLCAKWSSEAKRNKIFLGLPTLSSVIPLCGMKYLCISMQWINVEGMKVQQCL